MLGLALDANSSETGMGAGRALDRKSPEGEMLVTTDNGCRQTTRLPAVPLPTTRNTKGKIKVH